MLDGNEKVYQKTLRLHEHRLQAMVMELERLICAGAIRDVTTTVSNLMLCHVVDGLLARGYPEPEQRMLNRIVIQSRILCILDCLHGIFFDRGSPVGSALSRKRHIELADFKQLERLMFTTREHTVAAMGEMHDLLIDPAEVVVRRGLAHMFKTNASASSSGGAKRGLYRQCAPNASMSAMHGTPVMLARIAQSKRVEDRCAELEARDPLLQDAPIPPAFSSEEQEAVARARLRKQQQQAPPLVPRLPPQTLAANQHYERVFNPAPPAPSTWSNRAPAARPGTNAGGGGMPGATPEGPEFVFNFNYARFAVEEGGMQRYGAGPGRPHFQGHSASGSIPTARSETQFYAHLAASIAAMPEVNRIQPSKEQCKRVLHRWTQRQITVQPYGQLRVLELWEKEVEKDLNLLREAKAKSGRDIGDLRFNLARLGPAMEGEPVAKERSNYEWQLEKVRAGYLNLMRNIEAHQIFLDKLARNKLLFENDFTRVFQLDTRDEARRRPNSPEDDDGFMPINLDVAQFDGRNLCVATAWLSDCELKEGENVLEEILLDFFNHRFQLPGKLVWVPRVQQPHVRQVLTIPQPSRDLMLLLPHASSASEAEKRVLGPAVKFLSANRTAGEEFLDHDIDTMGLMARNKVLHLPEDGQQSYRIRADDLSINVFETRETKTYGYQLDGKDYGESGNACGFFLGDLRSQLFESVETLLMSLKESAKKDLFLRLDKYDEPEVVTEAELTSGEMERLRQLRSKGLIVDAYEVLEDVDFDPWYFRVRARRGERIVYHWDTLLYPFRNVEQELKMLQEECMAKGEPKPDARAEYALRCQAFLENAQRYKALWPHPDIINDRLNRRFYSDQDGVYDVQYPEVALLKGQTTRSERDRRLEQVQQDHRAMAKAVVEGKLKLHVYRAHMKKILGPGTNDADIDYELQYIASSMRASASSALYGSWQPLMPPSQTSTPYSSAPSTPLRSILPLQGQSEHNSPLLPRQAQDIGSLGGLLPQSALATITPRHEGVRAGGETGAEKNGARRFSQSGAGSDSEQDSENDGGGAGSYISMPEVSRLVSRLADPSDTPVQPQLTIQSAPLAYNQRPPPTKKLRTGLEGLATKRFASRASSVKTRPMPAQASDDMEWSL